MIIFNLINIKANLQFIREKISQYCSCDKSFHPSDITGNLNIAYQQSQQFFNDILAVCVTGNKVYTNFIHKLFFCGADSLLLHSYNTYCVFFCFTCVSIFSAQSLSSACRVFFSLNFYECEARVKNKEYFVLQMPTKKKYMF